MHVIKAQDGIIYAKYETSGDELQKDEQEVSVEVFLLLDVPCTMDTGPDGEIIIQHVEPPVVEFTVKPTPAPEPPGPSLEDDMMTIIVDHEARLTAVETGVTL